jgi:hypothetical protein
MYGAQYWSTSRHSFGVQQLLVVEPGADRPIARVNGVAPGRVDRGREAFDHAFVDLHFFEMSRSQLSSALCASMTSAR